MTPDEEGYNAEMYVSEEGSKIEATVETLWMTARHARVFRKPNRSIHQSATVTNGISVQSGRDANDNYGSPNRSTNQSATTTDGLMVQAGSRSIYQSATVTNGISVQAGRHANVNLGAQRLESSTHNDSQQMPFSQEPTAKGKDEIMAVLGLTWNTCKVRMKEYGITGPPWELPWSISIKIKASKKG